MRAEQPCWQLFAAAIAALLILPLSALGSQGAGSAGLAISNEFIRIRVNPGPAEAGRFAVDTTGGDPSRSSDDNRVLVYGSREPWTSYTTLLVDGKPFVFGGPTSRRAGLNAAVGKVIRAPQLSSGAISCAVRIGDVEVEQELSFARSPTTRVKDAARIAYQITNRGDSPCSVGLRLVVDTMLGANDGAPLRAGDQAISTAIQLARQEIPDYWQAFDSLSEPAVISQGTLRGEGLTAPDRMEMVDWGTLADSPWDYAFPGGADFTRRGEQEQDTAVALYWDAAPLEPGESRTYATLYGIGGVSLSAAQLSLGLTAPAEVDYQYEDMHAFSVVAYVENSGGFESRNTTCALELPKGLKLEQGKAKVELGLLKAAATRQLSWKVRPTGESVGPLKIAAKVTSENLEPNRVEREIVVNSPPQIALQLTAPDRLEATPENRYSPNPFRVTVTASNRGAQTGRNLVLTLSLPEGLRLARDSSLTQVRERLDPGKSQSFTWTVRALGMPTGRLVLAARAIAGGARPAEVKHVVAVPELTPEIRVYPAEQSVPVTTDSGPTLVPIAIHLVPARQFLGCRVSVSYDPAVLEPLYVSRGDAFVEAGRLLSPWSGGRTRPGGIADIGGERGEAPALNSPEATLFTIVFTAKASGETSVSLEPSLVLSARRKEMDIRVVDGHVTVQTTEETR